MIDPINDPLGERLRSMALPVPPNLIPHALTRSEKSKWSVHPWRLTRVGASALALLMLMSIAGSYFAPRFAQALANAPVLGGAAGDLLRSVGLVRVPNRLTNFDDAANSSGLRIHLVGGYADGFQTVLIIRIDDAAGRQPSVLDNVKLTDQFGHSYEQQAATWSVAENGATDEVLLFAPIDWPASWAGARLSLEIGEVQLGMPGVGKVRGHWILHGTLSLQETKDLPVPAPGQLGGTAFRFVAVRASQAAIQVKLAIVGPLAGKLNDVGHIAGPQKPQPGLTIQLIDPHGLAQMQINGKTSITDNHADLEWMWIAPGAGHYQIVVTLLGEGAFTRSIDVP